MKITYLFLVAISIIGLVASMFGIFVASGWKFYQWIFNLLLSIYNITIGIKLYKDEFQADLEYIVLTHIRVNSKEFKDFKNIDTYERAYTYFVSQIIEGKSRLGVSDMPVNIKSKGKQKEFKALIKSGSSKEYIRIELIPKKSL